MLRRALVAVSAVGLVAAGLVTYQFIDDSASTVPPTRLDPGRVHALPLRDLPGGGQGKKVVGVPAGATEPFSLLGVTWDKAGTALDGAVRFRTRSAASGAWSQWLRVDENDDDAPNTREAAGPRARGGTSALWVGASNGVEVRVAGRGRALPAGLRVELVDPGTGRHAPGPRAIGHNRDVVAAAAAEPLDSPTPDPSESTADPAPTGPADPTLSPAPTETATGSVPAGPEPTTSGTPSPSPSTSAGPSAQSSTAPRPAIVSRAQWGADETLVKGPPTIDTSIKAAFVHHTDTGNNYTCSQSPAVIRSIFLYHVKSEGWDDIGYNFLVDKCGTIFEGRAGGADRPVHGAHTYGFNTDTTGIAMLGTYTTATETPSGVAPTQSALSAVAKVAAWKLGLNGGDPAGKVTLTSLAPNGTGGKYPYNQKVTFNTISGHRDGFATACPGKQLYDQLPAIRTTAKQWTAPATTSTLTLTGLAGATKVGTTYYTRGAITPTWSPAAVSSYEVRVDGATVARPAPTATSATLTVPVGAHTLRLHATNINGTTADSPAYPIITDTTKPVFATPAALGLRRTTVSTTSIPVTLGWKVTDNKLLTSLKATSPAVKTFTTTTTSWSASAKPGAYQLWSLTAADAAGNLATSAVTRTSALVAETSATRTGTWKTTSSSSYLGGRALYSGAKGASARWTFTGRSVGLITKRATNLGALYVYIDGVKVATVDTRSSTTAYRQLLWTKAWSTSARHTITIVVAGTSKRPTVTIDGIASIR